MSIHVERTRWCDVPKDILVSRLLDTLNWPQWSQMEAAEIERPGRDGTPSSPGEIRRFTSRGVTGREEVLESEGDEVLRYRLLSGMPLNNYVGSVIITESDGRTRIIWQSRFEPKYPLTGWLFSIVIGSLYDQTINGLVDGPKKS